MSHQVGMFAFMTCSLGPDLHSRRSVLAPTFMQKALSGCSVGTRVGSRFVMLFRGIQMKQNQHGRGNLESLFFPVFNSEFVPVVLTTILEDDCAAFTTK